MVRRDECRRGSWLHGGWGLGRSDRHHCLERRRGPSLSLSRPPLLAPVLGLMKLLLATGYLVGRLGRERRYLVGRLGGRGGDLLDRLSRRRGHLCHRLGRYLVRLGRRVGVGVGRRRQRCVEGDERRGGRGPDGDERARQRGRQGDERYRRGHRQGHCGCVELSAISEVQRKSEPDADAPLPSSSRSQLSEVSTATRPPARSRPRPSSPASQRSSQSASAALRSLRRAPLSRPSPSAIPARTPLSTLALSFCKTVPTCRSRLSRSSLALLTKLAMQAPPLEPVRKLRGRLERSSSAVRLPLLLLLPSSRRRRCSLAATAT